MLKPSDDISNLVRLLCVEYVANIAPVSNGRQKAVYTLFIFVMISHSNQMGIEPGP